MTTTNSTAKRIKEAALVFTLAMMVTASAHAAAVTCDNWSSTDASERVTVTYTGGTVSATFPKEFGNVKEVSLIPGTTNPDAGTFTGNYLAAGVTELSFEVDSAAAIGAGSLLRLESEHDRFWNRRNLAVGQNTISFDRADWQLPVAMQTGDLDQLWAQDLSAVKSLRLLLVQNTSTPGASTVTVSAFALNSSRAVGAVVSLEDRLMAVFGKGSVADLMDEEIAQDTDGDGMTDLNEILAENDPENFFGETLFKAEVLEVGSDAVTVRFACVAGQTYTILRASEVGGLVEPLGPITAGETGYIEFTDENPVDGNAFYHILQN